jgi:hypothetical protein
MEFSETHDETSAQDVEFGIILFGSVEGRLGWWDLECWGEQDGWDSAVRQPLMMDKALTYLTPRK